MWFSLTFGCRRTLLICVSAVTTFPMMFGTTEGNVVHYGYIEKFIENIGEKYNIREIAFDR